MVSIFEAKKQQAEALHAAEAILNASGDRGMSKSESEAYDEKMAAYESFGRQIVASEKQNTVRQFFRNGKPGPALLGGGEEPSGLGFMGPVSTSPLLAECRTSEYKSGLLSFLRSGGKSHSEALEAGADGTGGFYLPGSELFTRQRLPNGSFPGGMTAASYEGTLGGSDSAGGYAISVPTIQQIVPLAMPDLGLLDASMVIETATPVYIPTQQTFGTSALKAESTGTTASFGGTDATLGRLTLDAYMVGRVAIASWELLQDVQIFSQFLVDDLLRSQRIEEGLLYASGTGAANKQPTGVFGATGVGTGSAYALAGTSADAATLLDSLFDVVGTLKAAYAPGASWIMSRATCLAIRRAQLTANLFAPVVTVDANGTTRILGWPVYFEQNAPALPTATTAGVPSILFGDFKQGVVIGLRGGQGINVKVLDQPLAMQGQLAILAYRRVDSQIRRSEAIQQILYSHA